MTQFSFVNPFDIYDYSDEESIYDKYFKEGSIGFRTKNTKYFKHLITFVSSIIDTINLKFTNKGVYFTSMDSSHIALIDGYLPVNFFSCYNVSSDSVPDNQIVMGINLPVLIKIMNHVGKNDELIFSINDNNLDVLNITIVNEKCQKYYSLKLMDIMSDELQVEEIPDTIKLKIDSRYFKTIISEFKDIGEVIKIKFDKKNDEISFSCEGEMTTLVLVLENEDIEYRDIRDLEVEFTLNYFDNFSKGFNLNRSININITDDNPLNMSYKVLNTGFVNLYIAPRMRDDDEF